METVRQKSWVLGLVSIYYCATHCASAVMLSYIVILSARTSRFSAIFRHYFQTQRLPDGLTKIFILTNKQTFYKQNTLRNPVCQIFTSFWRHLQSTGDVSWKLCSLFAQPGSVLAPPLWVGTVGGRGLLRGPRREKKSVRYKYIYSVFDIKPTYNH